MRGQFQRADGLILPNNISKAGAAMILEAAFRNNAPSLYVGLVVGAPSADMTMANMLEPTIGLHGYGRIQIPRNNTGWPTVGEVGGERFISTDWLTWAAVGADFDRQVQRMAIVDSADAGGVDTQVLALSVALPSEITITPTTPLAQRQFKYTIFL